MYKLERKKFGDPKKAMKKAIPKTNLEMGVRIAAQAKLLAPVDLGQLRNGISVASLKTELLLNDGTGEQAEGLKTQGLKDDAVYVGANVQHAVHQEYGTRKQPAQPFLRPAKEHIVDGKAASDIIVEYGREAMEREMRKL